IQSERELKGDSAAFAWLTALVVIMAEPDNSYEIAGVLREMYGISDHVLAEHAQGDGKRLCLTSESDGPVGQILRELDDLRKRIAPLPLFSAVNELLTATRLHDRLAALPEDAYPDSAAQIEALLTSAAIEESDG